MKYLKYAIFSMIVGALIFASASYLKSPVSKEKSVAKAAMDAAVAAGADKYAAADFKVAKDLWNKAEFQMTGKKYADARQYYVDAKPAFEKAAGGIEAGKVAMAKEVPVVLASLETNWKKLQVTFGQYEKRMSDSKIEWATDNKTFAEELKAAKTITATNLAGAKAKADELKNIIDKWDTSLKEAAALPALASTGGPPVGI
jgi:hypothetical protein